VTRVSGPALALLVIVWGIVAGSVPARGQPAEEPAPPAASQPQTIPLMQQSPNASGFSPLFGPYSPPPTAGAADQLGPAAPFMRRGGRAVIAPGQTERVILTPSLLVDEAYTDNVFLDNDFKRSDFITSFTPGLLFGLRGPDFGLGLGYVFTSEIYAKETQLNDALARWGASLAGFYNVTPKLTLELEGGYFEDNNTTASGVTGISTGRTRSRGGTVNPNVRWEVDPVTTLQLRAAWYTQTFDQDQFINVPLSSYTTYTITPSVARRITPTLTGTFQYQYLFSNVDNGQDVEYHLILPGVAYQFAPDFSATLSLGPQITTQGQTGTSLAVQLGLAKTFAWGAIGLTASRGELPAGGVGGSTETNTVGLSVILTNFLARGLTVNLSPSYTNSSGDQSLGTTDSINLQLVATYPLTRWLVAVLAYNFYRQHTDGPAFNNIDANRVTVGVQLFDSLRFR
jgi:hypothetical protein